MLYRERNGRNLIRVSVMGSKIPPQLLRLLKKILKKLASDQFKTSDRNQFILKIVKCSNPLFYYSDMESFNLR